MRLAEMEVFYNKGEQMIRSSTQSWRQRHAVGVCLLMGYLVLVLFAITLAILLNPNSSRSFFIEFGKGAALTGFRLLTLQVVLSLVIALLKSS